MLQRFFFALLVGAAISAQAQIPPRGLTHLDTTTGFTFGGSYLWIRGVDIVDTTISCEETCSGTSPCPVAVLFGDTPAHVWFAMPDIVAVTAPAHAEGVVDVTVRVPGKPDLVLASAYTYSRDAFRTRPEDYAFYLVPIVANRLAGAHGSIWVSEWSAFNASNERARLVGVEPTLESGDTKMLQAATPVAGRDGAFVYVPRLLAAELAMELRIRDVSRAAEGWGTELPVVGRRSYARLHRLLDIPTDPRYRVTLRVYGDSNQTQPVTVRVYPLEGATPIDDRELDLAGVTWEEAVDFSLTPAYLQLDPITDAVRAAGHERVRIEVFTSSFGEPPFEPGIWTFASITNNATQQVTVITPRQY
ncbi:MAG TPA: IPT/TIG domain-containing protein [Thermoanaerobaculia bacterium]|nr:IPT/TIG domain-containing protein [Thermoanaerobaculia bacterium]